MSLLDPSDLAGVGLVLGCSALVFAESGILLGFFLPGDTVLFAAGLATASPRVGVATWVLALSVGAAAVAGDAVGFVLGRRYGRAALEKRVLARFGRDRLDAAEAFYARYGALSLVVARFIPWVRTVTPLLAGALKMPYARFALGNVSGALSWAVALVVIGRASASVPVIKTVAIVVAASVVGLSFLLPAVAFGRRLVSRRRHPGGGREAGPTETGPVA